jgi:hypothetical protein
MRTSGKAQPKTRPLGEEADESDESVDVHGAARFLSLSVSYLNKLHATDDGPMFMQIGKKVLYRLRDLRAWQVTRLRRSTSDPGAPVRP